MSGFGCPLCWYYNRRFRVVASVPYQDWIREMGRELESGEVILLGGLAFRRTMDNRVEVLVEEVGADSLYHAKAQAHRE